MRDVVAATYLAARAATTCALPAVGTFHRAIPRRLWMSPTKIEWTNESWNPMTGCTKITSGCDHCYAFTLAHTKTREAYLRRPPLKDTPENLDDPFAPRFWPERLEQPLRWKESRRIFVNSMSDVFHAGFSLELIKRVFDVMNRAHWHQFQLLTKRPERAVRYASKLRWTPNIWMGTSIEKMDVARRATFLRQIPAHVRFISAEPLLGPLNEIDLEGIHWVIGGGESGRGFRAPDPAWALSLRDLCQRQGVPFFWKQWGGITPTAGGRLLDGELYDAYPVDLPPRSTEQLILA